MPDFDLLSEVPLDNTVTGSGIMKRYKGQNYLVVSCTGLSGVPEDYVDISIYVHVDGHWQRLPAGDQEEGVTRFTVGADSTGMAGYILHDAYEYVCAVNVGGTSEPDTFSMSQTQSIVGSEQSPASSGGSFPSSMDVEVTNTPSVITTPTTVTADSGVTLTATTIWQQVLASNSSRKGFIVQNQSANSATNFILVAFSNLGSSGISLGPGFAYAPSNVSTAAIYVKTDTGTAPVFAQEYT